MYHYWAYVNKVVDGDTFDMDIDLGFYTKLSNVRMRLLKVDTPESRGTEKDYGKAVTQYVKSLIEHQWVEVYVEKSESDYTYHDVYGRWLVNVMLPDGSKPLFEHLRELGVDKNYETYSQDNCLKLLEMIG